MIETSAPGFPHPYRRTIGASKPASWADSHAVPHEWQSLRDEFPEIQFDIVLVTPELAERLLATQARNRTVSPDTVARISRSIASESWCLNGETIVLDHQGRLVDGQHRCHAIKRSGRSVPVCVVWGVHDRALLTYDMGRARTNGQTLRIMGHHNATTVAAAGAIARNVETGRMPISEHARTSQYTAPEIQDTLQRWPDLIELAPVAVKIERSSHSLTCFLFACFKRQNPDAAQAFIEAVLTGEDLMARDPRLLLRNKFFTNKNLSPRRLRLEQWSWTVRAWLAFCEGRKLATLYGFIERDGLPDPGPIPNGNGPPLRIKTQRAD